MYGPAIALELLDHEMTPVPNQLGRRSQYSSRTDLLRAPPKKTVVDHTFNQEHKVGRLPVPRRASPGTAMVRKTPAPLRVAAG
jgi:hypothetical protein